MDVNKYIGFGGGNTIDYNMMEPYEHTKSLWIKLEYEWEERIKGKVQERVEQNSINNSD